MARTPTIIHEDCGGALKTLYYADCNSSKSIRVEGFKVCNVCKHMIKIIQEEIK